MDNQEIKKVLHILKRKVKQWKVPIVGQIEQRTRDPFLVLISCILSLRTKDKVTEDASKRLFSFAHSPDSMVKLPKTTIQKAIYPVGFYRRKTETIRRISKLLVTRYHSIVPDDIDELLKFPGVGRKTANLVVTVAYKKPGICVDTHVHRIVNRWGYVSTENPEQTEIALRKKLPTQYWIQFNDILVTFGQNFCKPISPNCSVCEISQYCKYYTQTYRKRVRK
jgi:endonuclease-3